MHRDGAMSEQVLVPMANLFPADGLSLAEAATVEFFAVGAHAVRRSMAIGGQRVLVMAPARSALAPRSLRDRQTTRDNHGRERGTAGLCLAAAGFLVIDASKGAVPEKVSERTVGTGFDVVYDATGKSHSIQAAFAYVAHGGVMVIVSASRTTSLSRIPNFTSAR